MREASPAHLNLWDAIDAAALSLMQRIAGNPANNEYAYNNAWHAAPPTPAIMQRMRDGLGTTHHEAGTLWIGASQADSATNSNGRFRHVTNGYVAGPAIFPSSARRI